MTFNCDLDRRSSVVVLLLPYLFSDLTNLSHTFFQIDLTYPSVRASISTTCSIDLAATTSPLFIKPGKSYWRARTGGYIESKWKKAMKCTLTMKIDTINLKHVKKGTLKGNKKTTVLWQPEGPITSYLSFVARCYLRYDLFFLSSLRERHAKTVTHVRWVHQAFRTSYASSPKLLIVLRRCILDDF